MQKTLILGNIWHITTNPFMVADKSATFETHSDGGLLIDADGRIAALGTRTALTSAHPDARVIDHRPSIILPGFVDTHVHFPQMDMIGAYGEDLLGWLNTYTFPQEAAFTDQTMAARKATRFFNELFANGTTLSAIFSSPHLSATEALFHAAADCGARAIIGKTSMDRHAPEALLSSADADLEDITELHSKWHRYEERLHYALTPRFAPTSTPALLESHAAFKQAHPDLYVQTHFSESPAEIAWVQELFPKHRDYLDVYESFGLLGERCILAHALHPSGDEITRLAATKTKIAHCPTSNLFLGSGLLPKEVVRDTDIAVSLGTDVGAGTSFSHWSTMADAYKVQRLQGHAISPEELLYLATLGGAVCLSQEEKVGNFAIGKEADLQVIDWQRSRLLEVRMSESSSARDQLFALMFLGSDHLTEAVYVRGQALYEKSM